jgi:two-component system, OmpR family, heavy metal sensor histidine kinase CusS
MPSVRSRLLSRTTALLVLMFAAAAVAVYVPMRASLLHAFDAALQLEARALASQVERMGGEIVLEFDLGELPEYAREERPHYFQIWSPDGHTEAKSHSLENRDLEKSTSLADTVAYQWISLPDGSTARQVSLEFQPRLEDAGPAVGESLHDPLTISVIRDTVELDATLATLAWLLLIVMGLTVALTVFLLDRLLQQGLKPLNTLAAGISQVGISDLSERLQIANAPTELVPVVERLNELLARLDATLMREKSFTADVAHELRTPLAGLRAALDVCATRPRSPEAYQQVIGKCLRVTESMQAMVSNLLMLARADAQQLTIAPEAVAVDDLLRACWSPYASTAQGRQLDLQWDVDLDAIVQLDREKASLVFKNLFENAVDYAAEAGWVRVTARFAEGNPLIVIANNGCQLKAADVEQLFNRFWRGDAARTDAGLHSGLGLSLCQKIVEVLGGTIVVSLDRDVFAVKVILPRASQATPVAL